MSDTSPDKTPDQKKEDKDSAKDSGSPEVKRDANDMRDKNDLIGWLDDSPKVPRKSRQRQTANARRRTTLVGSQVPFELRDIIGQGGWVEAPTPEQIKSIQSTTPAALKYMIDLVSSMSSVQSASSPPSSPSSLSSPSSPGSPVSGKLDSPNRSIPSDLTPEIIQQRIEDTKRIFLQPVLAELEQHQLRFGVIILIFVVILIHMAVSLLGNDN